MKAVVAVNLGKQYRIGGPQAKYATFRDALTQTLVAPIKRARNLMRGQAYGAAGLEEEIWALKNINFEVEHGEVVGIIGHNGAGKSTLLKVLSRITEPTTGYVDIYGRVGSLLEVGTGFHQELTGRENIYLNGAILGMSRAEINRKFDEIVDFAGVEKFIDTPVKHYSSGMRLRLGFSVAAHLEPEILVVDEVLAVGDISFQKKCLGKMQDVAEEGRTVLFVSHNMAAIEQLCTRVILLESGMISQFSETKKVVEAYVMQATQSLFQKSRDFPIYNNDETIGISSIAASITRSGHGKFHTLTILVDADVRQHLDRLGIGVALTTLEGVVVSSIFPSMTNYVITEAYGEYECHFQCEDINRYLAGGRYYVNVWLSLPRIEFLLKVDRAIIVDIPPVDIYGGGIYFEVHHGIVPLPMKYTLSQKSATLPES
ncbi:MAG: polysaccharide ABC transporter ATP-binding protein [Chloroflexi bacterium]|nr:polysaccharide ABC transporter ATP-binding protein [Chloroflexota bacterium]